MKKRTPIIAAALAVGFALLLWGIFNPAASLAVALGRMDERTKDAIAYTMIVVAYGPLFFCAVVAIWKGLKGGIEEAKRRNELYKKPIYSTEIHQRAADRLKRSKVRHFDLDLGCKSGARTISTPYRKMGEFETVGELKQLLAPFDDRTPVVFVNQPRQHLHHRISDGETMLGFQ